MTNPLLTDFTLPPFSAIEAEHIQPAVEQLLQQCQQTVTTLLQQSPPYTWQNLCQPLAEMDDKLSRVWSPISHLNSVKSSPAWRQAYEACLPLLSEYSTWLGQHQGLYQAYQQLRDSDQYPQLTTAQQKVIDNMLRDFQLSGIALAAPQQKRYGELSARLSELAALFSNNVLDATMAWSRLISDKQQLAGVPDSILAACQAKAQEKGEQGWLLTLDMPCYLPIMSYCDNAALRQEMYQAYVTRASDQGPHAGQWDNSPVMDEILALRHELAKLLGFANYAEQSLATKMAQSPQQVLDFLYDLAQRARPQAEQELAQLQQFSQQHYGITQLQPWDISYYSEKQKQNHYQIDDEQLRPYFPANRVLNGLFTVVNRLYGIQVALRDDVDCWHHDVQYYDLLAADGQVIAGFYLDLYAREHKRGGAWMDDCVSKLAYADGHQQLPVAYLTCNFNGPLGEQPALFTHDEVTTLFHEFGHGLHHMLTHIDVAGVAGIQGVPWDAVELPSQFMENWCWQEEALAIISGHFQTGEPLPSALLSKLLAAKNYQAALFILRQLEFGLFDFRLHLEYQVGSSAQVLTTLAEIKRLVAVVPSVEWNRFPHSFSHIFAGGYAAGYYSYLWADVLAADAYSRFAEEGIFNRQTGQSFWENILAKGGSEEPMELFKRFRGRQPQLEALLTQYGIIN